MVVVLTQLVTFSLVFILSRAWHIPDPNPPRLQVVPVRGFVNCHCSASTHSTSYSLGVLGRVNASLHTLNAAMQYAVATKNMSLSDARAYVRPQALEELKKCFEKSGFLNCIKADRQARAIYDGVNTFTFCTYDMNNDGKSLGRNLARVQGNYGAKLWVTAGICKDRARDPYPVTIDSGGATDRPGMMYCSCSPNGDASPRAKSKMSTILQGIANMTEMLAKGALRECGTQLSYTDCINADAELRDSYNMSMCKWASINSIKKTNRNTGPDFYGDLGKLVTVGRCPENLDSMPVTPVQDDMGPAANLLAEERAANSRNEGCIAVEHLIGRKLQHRRNLLRHVLCHDDFCATPNHAIYWQGTYTSMGELCTQERFACVSALKEVNNLKISKNPTRIRINDNIEITPFDVRFPWALIYAVHVLENILELLWTAFTLSFVATTLLFFYHSLTGAKWMSS